MINWSKSVVFPGHSSFLYTTLHHANEKIDKLSYTYIMYTLF